VVTAHIGIATVCPRVRLDDGSCASVRADDALIGLAPALMDSSQIFVGDDAILVLASVDDLIVDPRR